MKSLDNDHQNYKPLRPPQQSLWRRGCLWLLNVVIFIVGLGLAAVVITIITQQLFNKN